MNDDTFGLRSRSNSLGLSSYDNSKYMYVILRRSFAYISDFKELMVEYKNRTGKEYDYDYKDQEMATIIIESGKYKNDIEIVKVRTCFNNYITIISHMAYDDIKINYDGFKIDMIKMILGSEREMSEVISRIEHIVFMQIKEGIIK